MRQFISLSAPSLTMATVSDFKSFKLYHQKKLACLCHSRSSRFSARSPVAELKPLVVSSQESSLTPITPEIPTTQDSFTVSYLISSCGLSLESAISASLKVKLKSAKRPDSVLALLKTYGFSRTQIANFVRKRPQFLLASPEKTLLPKLEFFRSIGLSSRDLARIISSDPTLLTRSLRKQILPSYVHLKSVFLSDEKIVAVLKRTTWIFAGDQTKSLIPNIAFLREQEVPERCISLLLNNFPTVLMQRNEDFVRVVGEVKEMGFEPNKSTFVVAVHAMSGKGSKTLRERSFQVYRRWGWSKDDILRAFRKHPNCMLLSEDKIMKNMDYFVNRMGYPSRMISHNPIVLFFSLEKRIIPRFSVIRVLASKGLMKRDLTLQTVLQPNERRFLKRFVLKYEGLAPELLSVYYGKLKVVEVASAES